MKKLNNKAKDYAEVVKMYGLLKANGFHRFLFDPELERDGSSIWHRQCGTPYVTEVRLYNSRFFRISAEGDFEVATGVGITQLRSALRSRAVR